MIDTPFSREVRGCQCLLATVHKDKGFAENLAMNLVRHKLNVWIDKWELNVGDSLIEKIQSALVASSAILLVLSRHSIGSPWCKKELNSGLMRELEEKKTLLLPCVIDDCEIPLFLKEKLFADFRTRPDEAFKEVKRALAGISNPLQGRAEQPEFHTDWSIDWKRFDNLWIADWAFVDHGGAWPYVVFSRCTVLCNNVASLKFQEHKEIGKVEDYLGHILSTILAQMTHEELMVRIQDARERSLSKIINGVEGEVFHVEATVRRMGMDNGMDTLLYLDNDLKIALQHMTAATFHPRVEGNE